MVTCPHCAKEVEPDRFGFCPSCGQWAYEDELVEQPSEGERTDAEPAQPNQPAQRGTEASEPLVVSTTETMDCPECGATNASHRTYCTSCGTSLHAAPPSLAPPNAVAIPEGSSPLIPIIVVIAVVAAIVLFFVLRSDDGGLPTSNATSTTAVTVTSPTSYVVEMTSIADTAGQLSRRANEANAAWNARDRDFATTRADLEQVANDTRSARDQFVQISVPINDDTVTAHQRIAGLIDNLIAASDGMIEGLDRPAPDDGSFRRQQLQLYQATAAQIQNEVERL